MLATLLLFAGLILLVAGAELLVRGAVALARGLGVSSLLIGLTVVAYGTSAPELVVSLNAALKGSTGIAVGNVVGSNTFNLLLILGATALIVPIACHPRALSRDCTVMIGASLLLAALGWRGELAPWHGGAMLALLAGVTLFAYLSERRDGLPSAQLHRSEGEEIREIPSRSGTASAWALGGLALLVSGADLFVDGASDLARSWGISETVIGLTLVAAGTSLPELSTSLVAALRGHGDVALGNVVGSNTFNILGILGASSAIAPLPIPGRILAFDLWALLAVTLGASFFMFTGRRISRAEGAAFLAAYGLYVFLLFSHSP